MKDHPCLLTARQMTAEDESSSMWRGHWFCTLFVQGEAKFKGSYRACQWAAQAFASLPYELKDVTGRSHVSNR